MVGPTQMPGKVSEGARHLLSREEEERDNRWPFIADPVRQSDQITSRSQEESHHTQNTGVGCKLPRSFTQTGISLGQHPGLQKEHQALSTGLCRVMTASHLDEHQTEIRSSPNILSTPSMGSCKVQSRNIEEEQAGKCLIPSCHPT